MEKRCKTITTLYGQHSRWGVVEKKVSCPTLTASMGCGWWIYPYGNKKVAKKIIRIGQVSIVNSQAGIVYHRKGKMVTLIAGTHGYAMGYVLRKCRNK